MSSTAAMAMPSVGDSVVYAATVVVGDKTVDSTIENSLVEKNSKGQFLMKTTTTVKGQTPRIEQAWVDSSTLKSDSTITQTLEQCLVIGGTLDSVTVPAGTFNTCALTATTRVTQNTEWIGAVPFGIVQRKFVGGTPNGGGWEIKNVLQSYVVGK